MPPVVRHALMAKSRHDETSTGADKTVVTIRVFCRLCHKKVYKQVKSTYPQRAASVAGDWWRAADGGSPFVYRDSVRSPISRQCKNGSLKRPPENLSNIGRLIRLLKRLSLLFALRPRRRMTGGDSNVPEMVGGYRAFPIPGGNDWRRITRYPAKFVTKTYTDPPIIEKRMKNRQSFGGRGPEKRIRIRRSFSNEKNPPAICCRNRKTHSKPSVASPSPASAPVRSLCIKWVTTGPGTPKTINRSVTLKDEPHLRPVRNPTWPGRQATAPKDKPY